MLIDMLLTSLSTFRSS